MLDTEPDTTCDKNNMTFEYTRDYLRTIRLSRSIKAKKFSTGNKSVYQLLKRTCCISKDANKIKKRILSGTIET